MHVLQDSMWQESEKFCKILLGTKQGVIDMGSCMFLGRGVVLGSRMLSVRVNLTTIIVPENTWGG